MLVIVGTRRSDTIAIQPDDGLLEVECNGEFRVFNKHRVKRIVAFGMEGSDQKKKSTCVGSTFWSIFTGLLVALGVLFRFRERPQHSPEPPEGRR